LLSGVASKLMYLDATGPLERRESMATRSCFGSFFHRYAAVRRAQIDGVLEQAAIHIVGDETAGGNAG